MKIRQGFVSNSSSSSFVVVDLALPETPPNWPEDLVVDQDFCGDIEFGWGPGEVRHIGGRIAFAYLQYCYCPKDEWLSLIEDAIKLNTKVKNITWKISDARYPKVDDGKVEGYIDHQSSASEGRNTEIFDSLETMEHFIFGVDSKIVLDNDNH